MVRGTRIIIIITILGAWCKVPVHLPEREYLRKWEYLLHAPKSSIMIFQGQLLIATDLYS